MVANEQTVVVPSAEPVGLFAQIKTFGRAFWAANTMEMIERWAYYGVRTVLSLYIVDAVARGGLQFTHIQQGSIYGAWALVQSLLPMFTGGYADRYGYKKTVAISVAIKVAGYLLMGTQYTYWGFFLGCMLLAAGTAVFKPGVQGIIANSTLSTNASVGWGLFYAMVNIGGFLGPWTAGYLRLMSWSYVFYANAILVSLNFLTLLAFKEPKSAPVDARHDSVAKEFVQVLVRSVRDVFQPKLAAFLLIMSGFWLMFNQLFDYLTNFIDDWVDSSSVLVHLGRFFHNQTLLTQGLIGAQIPPEWMINIDAGAIVLLMVPIASLFRRMKGLHSIIWGILVSIVGLLSAGWTNHGAICILGIFVFAVGEMMASPKMNEYLAGIAPPEKRGLYMGYANVPLAIGWGIGGVLGGVLYQKYADKLTFARDYMAHQLHMGAGAIAAIPQEKVMDVLAARLHTTPRAATNMLFAMHHPERLWAIYALIGLSSMVGLVVYDRVLARRAKPAAMLAQ